MLCLLGLFLPRAVFASARIPEPDSRPLRLTIDFHKNAHDGSRVPLSGATFSAYKIADLILDDSGVSYRITDAYKSLATYENGAEVTFDGMKEEESNTFAKHAAILAKNRTPDASAVTENGYAAMNLDEQGMYLVLETSKEQTAARYTDADPFLINVPFPEEENGSYRWLCEVNAEPKTYVTKKTESEIPAVIPKPAVTPKPADTPAAEDQTVQADSGKTVKTSDTTNIAAWICLSICSGGAGICLGIVSLGRKRKESSDS